MALLCVTRWSASATVKETQSKTFTYHLPLTSYTKKKNLITCCVGQSVGMSAALIGGTKQTSKKTPVYSTKAETRRQNLIRSCLNFFATWHKSVKPRWAWFGVIIHFREQANLQTIGSVNYKDGPWLLTVVVSREEDQVGETQGWEGKFTLERVVFSPFWIFVSSMFTT